MRHTFELEPFIDAGEPAKDFATPAISIGGWVERVGQEGLLKFHYDLVGELDQLVIPASEEKPRRRDGLWQTTCLEWFGAAGGLAPYWECNLSPNGDWNLYRLADYRQELEEDENTPALKFTVLQGPNSLSLDLLCSLPAELLGAQPLELGICAVVEQRPNNAGLGEDLGERLAGDLTEGIGADRGLLSYWSLAHPGTSADFHLRQGWTMRP